MFTRNLIFRCLTFDFFQGHFICFDNRKANCTIEQRKCKNGWKTWLDSNFENRIWLSDCPAKYKFYLSIQFFQAWWILPKKWSSINCLWNWKVWGHTFIFKISQIEIFQKQGNFFCFLAFIRFFQLTFG